MTELKQQALDKMLEEMNKPHPKGLDQVHNWLCEQDDESLFTNILKVGKTITDAIQYAGGKAKSLAMIGNIGFTTDEEVYDWVVEYFASDKTSVKQVARVESTPKQTVKPITTSDPSMRKEVKDKIDRAVETMTKKHDAQKKSEKKPEYGMTSIFDFLDEPAVKTQAEIIAEIKAEAKANAWEDEVNEGDGKLDEVTEDAADE